MFLGFDGRELSPKPKSYIGGACVCVNPKLQRECGLLPSSGGQEVSLKVSCRLPRRSSASSVSLDHPPKLGGFVPNAGTWSLEACSGFSPRSFKSLCLAAFAGNVSGWFCQASVEMCSSQPLCRAQRACLPCREMTLSQWLQM